MVELIYTFIMLLCSVMLMWLGRLIARGEGDSLIAGYNTSSQEKRQEYDIERVRRLVSSVLYVVATLMMLCMSFVFLPEQWIMMAVILLTIAMVLLVVAVVVWGDKWTKKR